MTDFVIVCPECGHANDQPWHMTCRECCADLHGTRPKARSAIEHDDSRRLKHLEVTPEWIVDMLKHGNEIRVDVTSGLPEDAEFRRLEYRFDRDVYWLIVWSSAYDAVPEAEAIPETTVELTDVTDEAESASYRISLPSRDSSNYERPDRNPEVYAWIDPDAPRTMADLFINRDVACSPVVEYFVADYDPADYEDMTVDADDLVEDLEDEINE